jgi:hypothetical protein
MRLRSLLISPMAAFIIFGGAAAAAGLTAYTLQNPASQPVFNMITNNPTYGDERNFLGVRDIANATSASSLAIKPGQELALTVYFDNDAKSVSQAATNSKIRIALPASTSKNLTVKAFVSADNTTPSEVTDSVSLTSSQPVKLVAEPGSARLWNNVWRGQQLSDSISGSGGLIGYNELDGKVPAGLAYSGYVTLKVRVSSAVSSNGTAVPNTGPGNVIGLFLGVSAVASLFHLNRTVQRSRL